MNVTLSEYIGVLEKGKWFSTRSVQFKKDILERARIRRINSGEWLFARGEAANGVFAVLEGSIRISGQNDEGKESILTFIDPPDWFGELALFDGDHRTHDAVAAVNSTLLFLAQKELVDLLASHPNYWRDFGIMLSHKLRLSFGLIEDMALLPAAKRLAKRILMMAENVQLNHGTSDLVINVDQASLAAMLSVSRQTANQILKDLEEQACLSLRYGKITVLDMDKLRKVALSA